MLRTYLLLLALLLGLAAPPAWAKDEVFVLDNGSTFRGHVIRATDDDVQVQLAGHGRNATVTLDRTRIVTRFVPVDTSTRTEMERIPDADWTADSKEAEPGQPDEAAPAEGTEKDASVVEEGPASEAATLEMPALPAVEPSAKDEGFFHRLARVAVLSLPPSIAGRVALAGLFFIALLMLVMLGCRLAEIENLGLGRSAILASVLGLFVGADLLLHDTLLRADVATWVLPVQAMLWLALAVPVLRCGLARSVLLFAFVMFSLAVLVFTAGAILVTY